MSDKLLYLIEKNEDKTYKVVKHTRQVFFLHGVIIKTYEM